MVPLWLVELISSQQTPRTIWLEQLTSSASAVETLDVLDILSSIKPSLATLTRYQNSRLSPPSSPEKIFFLKLFRNLL